MFFISGEFRIKLMRFEAESSIGRETLRILEFGKIIEIVSGFAHGQPTHGLIREIRPFHEEGDIRQRFSLVSEITRLSDEGRPLALAGFGDIALHLAKARPEEAILEPAELRAFLPVLDIISAIARQLEDSPDLPALTGLAGGLTGFPEILKKIERSIDPEGYILDGASPELAETRARLRGLESRVRKRLEEIVRDQKISPFVQDEFITQRSGRWVLPIRMDSKGQVPGVVHDVSRSGETAFVEPLEIIGLSNELENRRAEEKAEEIRILRYISRLVRLEADKIEAQYGTIIKLDLANSIALFARKLEAGIPEINTDGVLKIEGGRHPLLLYLKDELGIKDIVPLDLALGGADTVLVITGPNAGGKTIAIKTAGLLLLMALSGIPVPASPSSSFPLVKGVLVDIGDEQSIEASLSTFAAHASNLARILADAGPDMVVLLDELGTGTDPSQGAAISCAVLKELREKGALALATTHLIDIVTFVHKSEGMLNASMEFDRKSFTPLYRLKFGEPGESYSLEIARRYGMPERVLEFARGMLGSSKIEFQELVRDLKETRLEYEKGLELVEREKKEVEARLKEIAQRLSGAERERKGAIRQALEEARDIVAGAKREVNALLDEAKREKKAREAAQRLQEAQAALEGRLKRFREAPALSMEEIAEGDIVHLISFNRDAKVLGIDIKTGRVRVQAGSISFEAPIEDISLPTGKALPKGFISIKRESPEGAVPLKINLVGTRVDEALEKIEPWLNDAALAGLREVTVIHGIGTGALMKAIREYLKDHPLVNAFRPGDRQEGGAGVTVIKLK